MGDGADPNDKKQYVQRFLRNGGATSGAVGADPLSPEVVAAKQRAARQMRDGMNSSFGTSTRGTDMPQGVGLDGPGAEQEAPIISDMDSRNLPQSVDENAAAAARRQAEQDARDRNGPSQPRGGGPRVYRQ